MSETEEREEQEGGEDREDRENHGEALRGGRGRGRGKEEDLDELDPSLWPFSFSSSFSKSQRCLVFWFVSRISEPSFLSQFLGTNLGNHYLKNNFIKHKVLQKKIK